MVDKLVDSIVDQPQPRYRVAVWRVAPESQDTIDSVIRHYDPFHLSLVDELVVQSPPKSRFVDMSVDRICMILKDIAHRDVRGHLVVVHDLDIVLASLFPNDMFAVWEFLRVRLPKPLNPILVVLPHDSSEVFDQTQQVRWSLEGRLVEA